MKSRRKFMRTTGFVSLGFLGLKLYACKSSVTAGNKLAQEGSFDYGPLVKDPAGVLDLPKGFSYKIISRTGDLMDDGLLVPGKQDGMGTFPTVDGKVIIICNHELLPSDKDVGAFGANNENLETIPREDLYEFGKGRYPGLGGTTTLIYNEETMVVEKRFLSLAGTFRNCAGGPTPWGSWLTCEEDVTKKGPYSRVEKDHGYVFEVPATTEMLRVKPEPIKAMGRFNHEAVAYDERTGILYLTEDRHDSLLYRFISNIKDDMHSGGKLQALAIKNHKQFDTRNWPDSGTEPMQLNESHQLEWIDMDNIDAPRDDLRGRGWRKGAARFARGEGMWYDDGIIYFACTNGGELQKGQIFKMTPDPDDIDGGALELFIEPNDVDIMKSCDNLTIAPWGDVMLCEDDRDAYLRGVTPQGQIFTFGHSTKYASEFAGICFSPSGKTMFVNIQYAGLTMAITGPWKS